MSASRGREGPRPSPTTPGAGSRGLLEGEAPPLLPSRFSLGALSPGRPAPSCNQRLLPTSPNCLAWGSGSRQTLQRWPSRGVAPAPSFMDNFPLFQLFNFCRACLSETRQDERPLTKVEVSHLGVPAGARLCPGTSAQSQGGDCLHREGPVPPWRPFHPQLGECPTICSLENGVTQGSSSSGVTAAL